MNYPNSHDHKAPRGAPEVRVMRAGDITTCVNCSLPFALPEATSTGEPHYCPVCYAWHEVERHKLARAGAKAAYEYAYSLLRKRDRYGYLLNPDRQALNEVPASCRRAAWDSFRYRRHCDKYADGRWRSRWIHGWLPF